jgi:hypothetical protein
MNVPELVRLMQQYIDEAPEESDQFLEGLDVTRTAAIELFNDFVLYANGGVDPGVKVTDPTS